MPYDNKISTGDEAAESVALLREKKKKIGYDIVITRGDYIAN
jgi:biotin synthase